MNKPKYAINIVNKTPAFLGEVFSDSDFINETGVITFSDINELVELFTAEQLFQLYINICKQDLLPKFLDKHYAAAKIFEVLSKQTNRKKLPLNVINDVMALSPDNKIIRFVQGRDKELESLVTLKKPPYQLKNAKAISKSLRLLCVFINNSHTQISADDLSSLTGFPKIPTKKRKGNEYSAALNVAISELRSDYSMCIKTDNDPITGMRYWTYLPEHNNQPFNMYDVICLLENFKWAMVRAGLIHEFKQLFNLKESK